jgi:hypothetical protein
MLDVVQTLAVDAQSERPFPWGDWQFWVASTIAAGALVIVVRPLLPRRKGAKSNCPGCPSAEDPSRPSRPKHVDLTIGGKRVRN